MIVIALLLLLPPTCSMLSSFLIRNSKSLNIFTIFSIALSLLIVTISCIFVAKSPDVLSSISITLMGYQMAFSLDYYKFIFGVSILILWSISLWYSAVYMKCNYPKTNLTLFFAAYNACIVTAICVVLCDNLTTIFIFYELLTLATIPLVLFPYTKLNYSALKKYLLYLIGTSSMILLPLIAYCFSQTGSDLLSTFAILPNCTIVVVLFILGFSKAGIFPFHKWLPTAMVAPAPVSGLLHGVAVVSTGVFCIFRVLISAADNIDTGSIVFEGIKWLCIFTVIFGSLVAVMSHHIKAMLAYSTISHLAFAVFLCLGLTPVSFFAGFAYLISHSISKLILFFSVGYIQSSYHVSEIYNLRSAGLKYPYPIILFGIGALIIIGFPLTLGSASEHLGLYSLYFRGSQVGIFTMIAMSIMGSIYLFPIVYYSFLHCYDRPKIENYFKKLQINRQVHALAFPIIMLILISFGFVSFYHHIEHSYMKESSLPEDMNQVSENY